MYESMIDETGKLLTVYEKYTYLRASFKEKLDLVRDEYKVLFIVDEIKSNLELLKKKFNLHYIKFIKEMNETPNVIGVALSNLDLESSDKNKQEIEMINIRPTQKNPFIESEEHLALPSYIRFLIDKLNFYQTLEYFNFIDVRWLGEISKFIKLYEILSKYHVINSKYPEFKRFWSLDLPLIFNSNIYETTILFYVLEEKGFITEYTIDSMIEKNLIFAKNGKSKNSVLLSNKYYIKNKSKYNDEEPNQFPTKAFKNALNEFGIELKV